MVVQGCSLVSHAKWLETWPEVPEVVLLRGPINCSVGSPLLLLCCPAIFSLVLLLAASATCWDYFPFLLRAVGILCFPQGGREVPLWLCSSWSTNDAFPLVVMDCFVKPLILWSSMSNNILKSKLIIDILWKCQNPSWNLRFPIIFCVVIFYSIAFKIYAKKTWNWSW